MKKYTILTLFTIITTVFLGCGNGSKGEITQNDSTGLPGDDFSLAAALDLFKESKSIKDFETKLNSKESKVNNLDLNGDGLTDYIRVVDKKENESHAIVLQALINKDEFQDVAVIALEKKGSKNVQAQIVGNEVLYGDSAIFEPRPTEEAKISQAGYSLKLTHPVAVVASVNVWLWPPVQYVYSPDYVVWESPVLWNAYPPEYVVYSPRPYGWYRRDVAHRHKDYYWAPGIPLSPVLYMYMPLRRNSIFVANRYQQIYVVKGMPKMKGHPYYNVHGHQYKDHGSNHAKMGEGGHGNHSGYGNTEGKKGNMGPKGNAGKEGGPKGGGGNHPDGGGSKGGQHGGSKGGGGSHGGGKK